MRSHLPAVHAIRPSSQGSWAIIRSYTCRSRRVAAGRCDHRRTGWRAHPRLTTSDASCCGRWARRWRWRRRRGPRPTDGEWARELQQRIDLARDLHERVVQRLFGVSMALTPPGPLDDISRERCADELQIALSDLRSALQRPLGRTPRPTNTTLAAELERLAGPWQGLNLQVEGVVPEVPATLEPLVQSVLREAVRNVGKHAHARSVVVRVHLTRRVARRRGRERRRRRAVGGRCTRGRTADRRA